MTQQTGWPAGMLQDDDRKLSRWLASRPIEEQNTMTEQPTPISDTGKSEALQLADALDGEAVPWARRDVAAELRRLHAENSDLREIAADLSGDVTVLAQTNEAHEERMALWTASHERMSRRIAELEQAARQAKEALKAASQHMDDCVALYAPDFTSEDRVQRARERVGEGGRLWVSANVIHQACTAIAALSKALEGKPNAQG